MSNCKCNQMSYNPTPLLHVEDGDLVYMLNLSLKRYINNEGGVWETMYDSDNYKHSRALVGGQLFQYKEDAEKSLEYHIRNVITTPQSVRRYTAYIDIHDFAKMKGRVGLENAPDYGVVYGLDKKYSDVYMSTSALPAIEKVRLSHNIEIKFFHHDILYYGKDPHGEGFFIVKRFIVTGMDYGYGG